MCQLSCNKITFSVLLLSLRVLARMRRGVVQQIIVSDACWQFFTLRLETLTFKVQRMRGMGRIQRTIVNYPWWLLSTLNFETSTAYKNTCFLKNYLQWSRKKEVFYAPHTSLLWFNFETDFLKNKFSGLSLSWTCKGPTDLFHIGKVRDRENYGKNQNFY